MSANPHFTVAVAVILICFIMYFVALQLTENIHVSKPVLHCGNFLRIKVIMTHFVLRLCLCMY